MRYLIPTNLNLTKQIPKASVKKNIYKYFYIIHELNLQRHFMKKYNVDDFVILNFSILKNIIGLDVKSILNDLKFFNIIESDNHYIVNEKSIGYRLKSEYLESKYLNDETNLISSKIKNLNNKYIYSLNSLEIKLFNDLNQINYNYNINNIYTYESYHTAFKGTFSNSIEISLDKILNKEFYFYQDEAGRIHTNLTNMKSVLRSGLEVDGQRLCEIDLPCSQPYFCGLLALEYLGHTKDLDLYLSLCKEEKTEEKDLYSVIMKNINYTNSRDEFKKNYLFKEFYYCDQKYNINNDLHLYFKENFPSIYNFVLKEKEGNYKNFSYKMQKLESDIIIQTVCRNIKDKYGDHIWLATIHDSILTLPKYSNLVKVEIEEVFLEKFKEKIKLEIKNY